MLGVITTLILSLIVLIVASERSVDSILKLAAYYGLSGTFVGLILLSFVTSLPEIFSHVIGSINIVSGALDYETTSIALVGANIGSNLFQQLLVLGAFLVITPRLIVPKRFKHNAITPLLLTNIIIFITGYNGFSQLDGIFLLITFFVYTHIIYQREHKPQRFKEATNPGKHVAITFVGVAALCVSAHYFLVSLESVASNTGVNGGLLGVLTLGIASAMPELMTTLFSYKKKATDAALGTLIGSNITNPLFAIGLGALISGYAVDSSIVYWDFIMNFVSTVPLYFIIVSGHTKHRIGGIILVALYAVYITVRLILG